jgi:hypothetical protein
MYNECELVMFEPYPNIVEFVGVSRSLLAKVQDFLLSRSEKLAAVDMLFNDPSHVLEMEVVHMHPKILPGVRRGVLVHTRDIFVRAGSGV